MNLLDTQSLSHFKILCTDGELGKIKDFYFDEQWFYLRYLVVDTSLFLIRHLVLISPICFDYIDIDKNEIHLNLSKQKLEDSPPFGFEETVSMKYERAYHQHFSWPYYGRYNLTPWTIGPYGIPWPYYESDSDNPEYDIVKQKNDLIEEAKKTRLRSTRELRGYSLRGKDNKKFGHLQSLILNTVKYSVEYFVIDTINYWPSKLVLVRPNWIKFINWEKKEVGFNLSKKLIVESPNYYRNQLTLEYLQTVQDYFSEVVLSNDQGNFTEPRDQDISFINK